MKIPAELPDDLINETNKSSHGKNITDSHKIFLNECLRTIIKILIIGAIVFLFINIFTNRIKIDGTSMEPTIPKNSYVLVDKITNIFIKPGRGDVIVFRLNESKHDYIKRVIGLPGETVKFSEDNVYINNKLLEESYLGSITIGLNSEYLLGDDEYFVMGDNRISSKDSRNFGAIHLENILGYARLIYWPPIRWDFISHVNYPYNKKQ